jgi:hypothetical protein
MCPVRALDIRDPSPVEGAEDNAERRRGAGNRSCSGAQRGISEVPPAAPRVSRHEYAPMPNLATAIKARSNTMVTVRQAK